ncbi:streptomycin 6-kinase [Crossiella equi]|uniref:Streptomycin 6-kinase n=1 Tax=Crossiella equi TaxID=130796 RepID=A0ABS5ART8_9PSEU|nr:aminoglycoside phosphotransferase family protein [Crossiella equi]MBP2479270.1 streptomycin 6-kinase [Crossiella equi]
MTFPLPAALVRTHADEGGRVWLAGLPALLEHTLDTWSLTPDGPLAHGQAAVVLPVRRADGTGAALRCRRPGTGTHATVLGLRAWAGAGAVRLLEHDEHGDVLLLERLDGTRDLTSVADDDTAMGVLAGLLRGLTSVPAPEGLPTLATVARDLVRDTPAAAAALPGADLLHTCAAAVAELLDEPGDRLLHWDLHCGNVLAAEREPWLAIDPEPLAGDPGFDLWPALDTRWDEHVRPDPLRVVRRRFDLLTEALDLDRRRAAGWTLGRVLQNCLWDVEDGATALAPAQVAVAEAVLPHWR